MNPLDSHGPAKTSRRKILRWAQNGEEITNENKLSWGHLGDRAIQLLTAERSRGGSRSGSGVPPLMNPLDWPDLSKARERQILKWAKKGEKIAHENEFSTSQLHKVGGQILASGRSRGGARPGSGTRSKDWADITGGQDAFGKFRGSDLLSIPLRLVIEGALYPESQTVAERFGTMMLSILAERDLFDRGNLTDGGVAELMASPEFREQTKSQIGGLLAAYQHAIRGRAVKAHQARKSRRELFGDWYNTGSRGSDWDWRVPLPPELR